MSDPECRSNKCLHTTSIQVRRKIANGQVVAGLQCAQCLAFLRNIPKQGLILSNLPWWDEAGYQAREERLAALAQYEWRKNYETRSGDWWDSYRAYLQSPHWHLVRKAVLERDQICQFCFHWPAEEAHHLSYATFKKFGKSFPAECVGVCRPCHETITEIERATRLA